MPIRRTLPRRRGALPSCCAILLAVGLLTACQGEDRSLGLEDLAPAERTFVERYIVLERARAVTLAEPALGAALLDSLAAAWGDSADDDARATLSSDAERARRLYDLVERLRADPLFAAVDLAAALDGDDLAGRAAAQVEEFVGGAVAAALSRCPSRAAEAAVSV